MFSFNLGKSSTSSDASSKSSSDAFSRGSSVQGSQSQDQVFNGDIFGALFGDASNVAGRIAGNAGNLTQAANTLFDSGSSFLTDLQELSGGGDVGAGEGYLGRRLEDGSSLLDDQIAQVGSDLSDFFGESILPQIGAGAAGAGQFGGSRQGVAEGIAAKGLMSEYARSVLSLRTTDQAQRDQAATTLAGLEGNRAGLRLSAAGAGLNALGGQLDLLNSGLMSELSPYLALSEILGGPTVLGSSSSFGTSSDVSGEHTESSSVSASRGKSWQIGAGGGGG